ncbi:hypothetical protein [Enterobacter cloacae complex sp. 285F6]
MIGTAREIALEMFRHSDLDGEKYVFAAGIEMTFVASALTGI